MRNITKLQGSEFVKQVCGGLLEMGATEQIATFGVSRVFTLNTVVDKLTITIPLNQSIIYSVFSRFENIELAKTRFGCNKHSGKYNFNMSNVPAKNAVDAYLGIIQLTLKQ